jgi:MraZ protein
MADSRPHQGNPYSGKYLDPLDGFVVQNGVKWSEMESCLFNRFALVDALHLLVDPLFMATEPQKPRSYAGEFRHGIDPKNRVTIPVSWRRDEDGELFYLRMDTTGSFVLALPLEECERIKAEVAAQLKDRAKEQEFNRMFLGAAKECRADKQGRLVVPPEFAKQAAIEGDAVLVGTGGRFELWNVARWDAKKQADSPVYDMVAGGMGL